MTFTARIVRSGTIWLLALFSCCVAARGEVRLPEALGYAMFENPQLELSQLNYKFPQGLLPLWKKALGHTEGDARRQAADSIVLASRLGMPDLQQARPLLESVLTSGDSRLLRISAARALVEIEARTSADKLLEACAVDGPAMSESVEPVLARWKHAGAIEVWQARIARPPTHRRLTTLALRGLAACDVKQSATAVAGIVSDNNMPFGIRWEAAKAIGQTAWNAPAAVDQLANSDSRADRMLAAACLRHKQGEASQAMLRELLGDKDDAVAAIAAKSMRRDGIELLLPFAKRLSQRDGVLRRLAAEAWLARASDDDLKAAGPFLADKLLENRQIVRRRLQAIAADSKQTAGVVRVALTALDAEPWEGREQAAYLLGTLQHKPAAQQLVANLQHRRIEVCLAASWALTKLAVPETAGSIFARGKQLTAAQDAGTPIFGPTVLIDEHFAQVMLGLGVLKHKPATQLMLKHVDGIDKYAYKVRSASAWSLGMLYEDTPEKTVVRSLLRRVTYEGPIPPEDTVVQRMAALSLGRMQAKDTAETLQRYLDTDPPNSTRKAACRWALQRMTGKSIPPLPARTVYYSGWFLEPLK